MAQGNGHYEWKDGRFEPHKLIGHTWNCIWFQQKSDREGGFTIGFVPDVSEGEGRGMMPSGAWRVKVVAHVILSLLGYYFITRAVWGSAMLHH